MGIEKYTYHDEKNNKITEKKKKPFYLFLSFMIGPCLLLLSSTFHSLSSPTLSP